MLPRRGIWEEGWRSTFPPPAITFFKCAIRFRWRIIESVTQLLFIFWGKGVAFFAMTGCFLCFCIRAEGNSVPPAQLWMWWTKSAVREMNWSTLVFSSCAEHSGIRTGLSTGWKNRRTQLGLFLSICRPAVPELCTRLARYCESRATTDVIREIDAWYP